MILTAAILSTVFVSLSALHWYWVFGGKFGLDAALPEVGGKRAFEPGAIATVLVAVLLMLAAIVCAAQAGFAGLSRSGLTRIGVGTLAFLFAARAVGDFRLVGIFRRVKGTRFARMDAVFFSPLCICIAALCGWLLYETRV